MPRELKISYIADVKQLESVLGRRATAWKVCQQDQAVTTRSACALSQHVHALAGMKTSSSLQIGPTAMSWMMLVLFMHACCNPLSVVTVLL